MRPFAAIFLVAAALALAACGSTASVPTPTSTTLAPSPTSTTSAPAGGTVTLGQRSFVDKSVTIAAGQAVRIVDPTDTGGIHRLCLGKDGTCDPAAQGPGDLHAPGETFQPGDDKRIAFPTAGQYHITCTIHPSMNLTVTVQ
jgi:plastocyanin